MRVEVNHPRLSVKIRIKRSTSYWLLSPYSSIVLRMHSAQYALALGFCDWGIE